MTQLVRVYALAIGAAHIAEAGAVAALCDRPFLPAPPEGFTDDPPMTWCEDCRIAAGLPEPRIWEDPAHPAYVRRGRRVASYLVSNPTLPGPDGVVGWTPEKRV